MSNYSQTTFFTPKDSLPLGNPGKVVYGAAYDTEFGNISTAISTKLDIASTGESVGNLSFTSATLPTNGLYLAGANTRGFATNSLSRITLNATGVLAVSGQVTITPSANLTPLTVTATGTGVGISITVPAGGTGITIGGSGSPGMVVGTLQMGQGASWLGGAGANDPVITSANNTLQLSGSNTALCMSLTALGNVIIAAPISGDTLKVAPSATTGALIATSAALTTGAGASAGTLTNAPSAGNPTKWIKINDNGTIRSVPAW